MATHIGLLLLLLDIEQVSVGALRHFGVVVARVQVFVPVGAQRQLLAKPPVFRLEPLHWVLQPAGGTMVLVFLKFWIAVALTHDTESHTTRAKLFSYFSYQLNTLTINK